MRGLNDFYRVGARQDSAGSIVCELTFNATHPIFEGHFPQQPVVPGVCTMYIVKALLEATLGKALFLKESSAVKFLRLMMPDSAPTVSVTWEEKAATIIVTATFKDADAAVFKMNGVYEIVQ